MLGIVSLLLIIWIGYFLMQKFSGDMETSERKLLKLGFVIQLFGVLSIIAITKYYYGGGDMLEYHRLGSHVARVWASNLGDVTPRVVEMFFQKGGKELVPWGAGSSSGSMLAIASFLALITGGSLVAMCTAAAVTAFLSRVLIYRVLRDEIEPRFRRPVLIGTILMPSVVFWSSGLLKETIALAAIGPLLWGAREIARGRHKLLGLSCIVMGAVICGLIKGYLLPPFVLAFSARFYVHRAVKSGRSIFARPSSLIAAIVAAFLLMIAVGDLLPRYDFRKIQEQILTEQELGTHVTGGSDYSLTDSAPTTTAGLVFAAPLAVVTALLRPAIFEARNPLALANGLETLVLTIMLLQVLLKTGFRRALQRVRNSSLLTFCVTFTLVLALGVGFSTTNMGTLSRYRMPLVPFFVTALVVLRNRQPKRKRSVNYRFGRAGTPTTTARLEQE